MIRQGGLEDLTPVIETVQRNGSVDYTREKAIEQVELAKSAIAGLADTSFKETLIQIADIAIERTH